jgi:hypothetical protein
LRVLLGDKAGAAAVEFALVAPLFFAMIFSVIELGWTMTKQMMLDRAMDIVVRELRIGRTEGFTKDYVRQRICGEAAIFTNCEEEMLVEMVPIPAGSSYPDTNATCATGSTAVKPVTKFNPGLRSEVVFIRACVNVIPLTPGIGLGLRLRYNQDAGFFMTSESALLNEPE